MLMPMLVNMIIRPPRNNYPSDVSQDNKVISLGGDGKKFVKRVFTLQNEAG